MTRSGTRSNMSSADATSATGENIAHPTGLLVIYQNKDLFASVF